MVLGAAPLAAQNLLINPGFDSNLAGWTVMSFSPQRSSNDANGSPNSGSARITVGDGEGGNAMAQCVAVTGGASYDFSTKVRINESGLRVATIFFTANATCGAFDLGAFIVVAHGPAPSWFTTHMKVTAPPGAQLAHIRLDGLNSAGGGANFQHWDDVYFGPVAPASCTPSATTLCLDRFPGDARFLVRGTFSTVQRGGLAGPANAISLASVGVGKGGVFWFFNSANPEMLVKVLDGCPSTGFFWVFVAAGTNVGVELFVADTVSGAVALFHNPDLGPYPAIQNTLGLPCP